MHQGVTFHASAVAHLDFACDQLQRKRSHSLALFLSRRFTIPNLFIFNRHLATKTVRELYTLLWLQARAQLRSLPIHSVHAALFCDIFHLYAFQSQMPRKPKPSKAKPPSNDKQKKYLQKALPNYHFHTLCVAFVQYFFLYSHLRRSRRLLENDAAHEPEREARMLP